ncbi:hypothetical protein WDJ51_04095 [Rathayibacter sp. YIM 133350]|uniref:hypothetical protein n=1 Tax=Rathayibacter sp. YIM 133350 TaxID=3131992 RepID=UPI00307FB3B3
MTTIQPRPPASSAAPSSSRSDAHSRGLSPMQWKAAGVAGVAAAVFGGLIAQNPMVVGAILGLLVVSGVIIWRPWLGLAMLVFILPLNGMISAFIGLGPQSVLFGAIKDYMLLLMTVTTFFGGRLKRVPIPLVLLVFVLLLLGGASAVFTPNFEQASYGWRNDFLPLLLLIVIPATVTAFEAKKLAVLFAIATQASALVTIFTWSQGIQWLRTLGRLPVPAGEEWPVSLFVAGSNTPRGFSPYVAPNEAAVAMTVLLAIIWCRSNWRIRTKLALSALPLVAIGLTQSRSGFVGLAMLALAILAFYAYKMRAMLVPALVSTGVLLGIVVIQVYLFLLTVLFPIPDPSLAGHEDSLMQNLPYLWTHPFGIGVGQVGPRAFRYSLDAVRVESFLLLLAIEAGILVLGLFLALLAYVFVKCVRAGSMEAYTAPAAIVGSLVSITVLPTLQEGPVAYTLWIAVGLGIVAWLDAPRRDPVGLQRRGRLRVLRPPRRDVASL